MTDNVGQRKLAGQLRLFGSATRTGVLIVLALVDESHPRELARILNASLSSVQLAVDGLEREGIVATRRLGSERRVTLDPRFYGAKALKDLLLKLSDGQPHIIDAVRSVRRRPRRRGKAL
ncbi:MAG: hypothetical protein ACXWNK_14455 [Vulcanimicrobiaceae bacterium]